MSKPKVKDLGEGRILVVGLGNPGPKYDGTRHNIGFEVVDELARMTFGSVSREKFKAHTGQARLGSRDSVLLKPQTYMNLSGQSVVAALKFYNLQPSNLVVVHDDIDLAFGKIRLKCGGGHGGHNGLRNIDKLLGTKDYFRIRMGVGRPEHGDVAAFVLKMFSSDEKITLNDFVNDGARAIEDLVAEGLVGAQNCYHAK